MATKTHPAEASPAGSFHAAHPDVVIYSHSPILYWWPVWLVGFCLALVTYLDGGRMAYVPAGTHVEGSTLVVPGPVPPKSRRSAWPATPTWAPGSS
jgi:hypothetical protein